MKPLKISLLFFILSTSISAQWYDLPNVPHGRCDAIDAYDSLIATGSYTVNSSWIPDSLYMTTNGGISWFGIQFASSIEIGDGPTDISIKGADKIWFSTGNGKIYRTAVGGLNWELQFYDTLLTKFMNYIEMFDEMNGMAMGDAPAADKPALFLKTTNGGQDWISQNQSELIGLSSGDLWRKVDFVDINTGYFFSNGESPQKLYKTTNSGVNWEVINDSIRFMVLKCYDENILVGEEANIPPTGIIHRTVDGGQNWESQQWNFLDWALDIELLPGDPSSIWCVSNSIAFSSDTGRTWVNEYDLQSGIIYDIVFTDENSGWIYAGGGGILTNMYRTTNGGHGGIVSVDEYHSDIILIGFKLEQNYPNPFNPSTSLQYAIGSRQFVSLKIYDLLGREVATLVNDEKPVGEYEVEFDGSNLPSGIYFYQLKAGGYVETKKMVLIR